MMYESNKTDGKRCICIYCMGEYGLDTYFKLMEKGIKIDYFADGDPQKTGYALDGVYCKSYEELLSEDKNIFLIVAKKNPETLISQFKNQGFQNVYDKESAVRKLVIGKDLAIEKAPLRDVEMIKKIKQSIQAALYNESESLESNLLNKNMISDYWLRYSKENNGRSL